MLPNILDLKASQRRPGISRESRMLYRTTHELCKGDPICAQASSFLYALALHRASSLRGHRQKTTQ